MKLSMPLSRLTDYRPGAKSDASSSRSRSQSGSAVLIVLLIIAILMTYVVGNLQTLDRLGHQVKLVEQKQELRLKRQVAGQSVTNSPALRR